MDILFKCGECSKSLSIDEKGRGLTVTCPDCGASVGVPNESEPTEPEGHAPEKPHLRLKQAVESTKACPHCQETIPLNSLFCTHCGTDLREGRPRPAIRPRRTINFSWVWLVLLIGVAIYGFRERERLGVWLQTQSIYRYVMGRIDPLWELKMMAKDRNVTAQFDLANALCSPTGTVRDVHQAFQLFITAANGGHKLAQSTVMKAIMGAWRPETNAPVIWTWLREAADGGNREACYHLGLFYNMNEDFGIDVKAAVPWFKKASDGGHQEAMFTMAMFLYAGELVATNREEAARLLSLIDPKQLSRAPEVLGLMTLAGEGVPKDVTRGLSLLETSVENGRAQAATTLGRIYLTGEAVPKDERKALQWFLKAGELGDARGMAKAGLLCGQVNDKTMQDRSSALIFASLSNNHQVAYAEILAHVTESVVNELVSRNPPLTTNDMVQFRRINGTLIRGMLKELGPGGPTIMVGTNAIVVPFTDLDVAGRTRCDPEFRGILARSLILEGVYAVVEGFEVPEPKASTNDMRNALRIDAEKGDSDAQSLLGTLLLKDLMTAHDGIAWLTKAADSGNPHGQYELGLAYYKGLGIPADKQEAFRLFSLAADQEHAEALLASGRMLMEGDGCALDEAKGFGLIRQSAYLRENSAILATGRYLYGDRRGFRDIAQAFAWFRLGAVLGMPEAQYWLGRMYYEGQGVATDYNRAAQWLSSSASQGFKPALELLNRDIARQEDLAAAREAYRLEQVAHSKRLERIRRNPKYDIVVPARKIPSFFGNAREKEAYFIFADNYMTGKFATIPEAVDDAWRNVGRRSSAYGNHSSWRDDSPYSRAAMGNVLEQFRSGTLSSVGYRPYIPPGEFGSSWSGRDDTEQYIRDRWMEAQQGAMQGF